MVFRKTNAIYQITNNKNNNFFITNTPLPIGWPSYGYMQDEAIKGLLEKYKLGTITDAEKAVLDEWYLHVAADSSEALSELERLKTFDAVLEHLEDVSRPARVKRLLPRVAAAASIILALGTGGYFLLHRPAPPVAVVKTEQDILPGGNKAYLVLSSGQRISLTDAKNGTVAEQAGRAVKKTADGLLVYDDAHSGHNPAELVYNTVGTPRGGQYQVVLPDGTKVWLNAASRLRYPAAFTGNSREVELEGEAYFQVAHNARQPFRVRAGDQLIEDIGTAFNINAYKDEAGVRTTLTEGAARVQLSGRDGGVTLRPGQQAGSVGDQLVVKAADTEVITAWKNGLFMFQAADIREVMRMVSRWYNVEINYKGPAPAANFSGGVSRFDKVSEVLRTLEATGKVHFKIQNRTITVIN
ncbi:FecR family protein [Mucilaginibacter segetis]|uniref:FecR domain-containing protein n=1 Tax=Mucilaginibacter segetis TaxID=2793071 RepID=A0A934PR98_9SPHI|nr:FecR domain-containing protein [Mucilaginibacter segetis]MBK0379309.1 FecR domain-containing protein [Mucilaginibacter segetis]